MNKRLFDKNKIKGKEVRIPVLNKDYLVVVCWGDSAYIHRVIKAWGYDDISLQDLNARLAGLRGVTFRRNHLHPVIALPKAPRGANEIASLAHEATHAVFSIFDYIGEDTGEEIFALSVGAIVRDVLEAIKR